MPISGVFYTCSIPSRHVTSRNSKTTSCCLLPLIGGATRITTTVERLTLAFRLSYHVETAPRLWLQWCRFRCPRRRRGRHSFVEWQPIATETSALAVRNRTRHCCRRVAVFRAGRDIRDVMLLSSVYCVTEAYTVGLGANRPYTVTCSSFLLSSRLSIEWLHLWLSTALNSACSRSLSETDV